MKKTFVLILFCLILFNAWSQTVQKNAIKISPPSLLVGTGSFFYEHKIDDKHSLQLGLADMNYTDISYQIKGVIITPEYRTWVNKNSISGIYIGPFLRYQKFKMINQMNATAKYASIGGGVLIGKQWIYRKGFVLDMFAGPIYNAGKLSDVSDVAIFHKPGFGYDGLGIRAGITLGFGF